MTIAKPEESSQLPDVEASIKKLVADLKASKGWTHAYADAIIRDAIDRRGLDGREKKEVPLPVPLAVGGRNRVLDDITWLTEDLPTGDYNLFTAEQLVRYGDKREAAAVLAMQT